MRIHLNPSEDDIDPNAFVELSAAIQREYGRIASAIRQFVEHGLRQHEEYSRSTYAFVESIVDRLSTEWRETLPRLAQHGWYLDSALSAHQARYVLQLFDSGAARKADALLMKHVEKHLARISAELKTRFPNRARVLRAAFAAHRARRYSLAIPVFLAQSDGISFDLLGTQLYKSKSGKPATATAVQAFEPGWQALLSPLLEVQPISAPTYGRVLAPGELNRHGILHGLVANYGTRLNSCKAVSLINYVGTVVARARRPAHERAG
jgi:hypothetical protein